jgi:hypothetical protein
MRERPGGAGEDMRATLLLCLAILVAGGLVAAAVAGHLSNDMGTRLRRECESIVQAVPMVAARSGLKSEELIQGCVWRRAGPGGTGE